MHVYHLKLAYAIVIVLFSFSSCTPNKKVDTKVEQNSGLKLEIPQGTQALFNGKNLDGWQITNFGTEGPIMVTEGKIVINMGEGASGITFSKDFPVVNYEINLEARKTVGNDFFCGITFPVKKEFCSFIVGGWGGPVLGLSCIDGLDASDNETKKLKRFDKNVWYKIKLRVDEKKIRAWIDDEKLIDFDYTNRTLSTRPEVNLSKPFGICTWLTTGELRNIWLKEIP